MTDSTRRRVAHRAALDHLLLLVTASRGGPHLILRGSMLMRAWFGERAREPADLDWVAVEGTDLGEDTIRYGFPADLPPEFGVEEWQDDDPFLRLDLSRVRPDQRRDELWQWGEAAVEPEPEPELPYTDLLDLVRHWPTAAHGVVLDADHARQEGMWEYDIDGEGLRLIIPWRAPGLSPGEVRLDFASDGYRARDAVLTAVPRGDGGQPVRVHSASREWSLAWKLQWLWSDQEDGNRAQGKDLYDAVLLAEDQRTNLPPELLREVCLALSLHSDPEQIRRWDVDWDGFRAGHPWVSGTAAEWLDRLASAVRPAFDDEDEE